MNKCKDPKMSMKIGGVLRDMMKELKGETPSLIIPYRFLPISLGKIEEGRKIIERMKMKTVIVEPAHNVTVSPLVLREDTDELISVYPLKRDAKGRMMKAEKR